MPHFDEPESRSVKIEHTRDTQRGLSIFILFGMMVVKKELLEHSSSMVKVSQQRL